MTYEREIDVDQNGEGEPAVIAFDCGGPIDNWRI